MTQSHQNAIIHLLPEVSGDGRSTNAGTVQAGDWISQGESGHLVKVFKYQVTCYQKSQESHPFDVGSQSSECGTVQL